MHMKGLGVLPAATGAVQNVPESERGMKLEAKCIDMHYDKVSGQFQAEERKSISLNNTDPYAADAFTLHHTVGASIPYLAYFDIRSPYLRKTFESEMGQINNISWTASPLRVCVMPFSQISCMTVTDSH